MANKHFSTNSARARKQAELRSARAKREELARAQANLRALKERLDAKAGR